MAPRGAPSPAATPTAREDFDDAPSTCVRRVASSAASVSATYPLDDYDDAIAHAATAGPRGAVKIAFDLREATE